MRKIEEINGISGVAPGGVSTLNMPLNRRYHALKVFPTGTIDEGGGPTVTTDPTKLIAQIRLIVNGVVIRELTPLEFLRIAGANFDGEQETTNVPIYFSEPKRASVMGEEGSSWDMTSAPDNPILTFVLEITWLSGITNPVTKVLASYDHGRNLVNGKSFQQIVKQKGLTFNAPAGDYDITSLSIRHPIQRLHFQPSAGTVSRVEVVRDDEKVLDAQKVHYDEFLDDYDIDSPFALSVAFDHEQQISSALKANQSLRVRVQCSDANNLRVITESISTRFE
jgi:hypothetical protein